MAAVRRATLEAQTDALAERLAPLLPDMTDDTFDRTLTLLGGATRLAVRDDRTW